MSSENKVSQVKEEEKDSKVSRRHFVKGVVAGAVVAAAAATGFSLLEGLPQPKPVVFATSKGYLLVDTTKCGACLTCMVACSTKHGEGCSLSLSRIQILRDPFAVPPGDISQEQCRQCVSPACALACPTGALHTDPNTNARVVDEEKCIGCQRCMEACPFQPARVQWNFTNNKSQKCDLCGGDPECVKLCPMHAIAFTHEVPTQFSDIGYKVDLKEPNWGPANWS